MRSFAIFLGLIALGFAGIAVFAYPAWELSQALGLDFKFHRVASTSQCSRCSSVSCSSRAG